MEDTPSLISSTFMDKSTIIKQLDILRNVQSDAQDIIDYENASNPLYLHAISIIEEFLKKKQRICYGGQAINQHLPKKLQFYNPKTTLPDYDFFTPSPEEDIRLLQKMLEREGFLDVHRKEGIHEGTTKIYVHYTPVADITYLDKRIYDKLHKDALVKNDIYYADSVFLKMMMHLELSRPRGEVQRWDKVYERLLLLSGITKKKCKYSSRNSRKNFLEHIPYKNTIIEFIKYKKLVFAGADVFTIIKKARPSVEHIIISSNNPIIVYSTNIKNDANDLIKRLIHEIPVAERNKHAFTKKSVAEISDIVPPMKLVYNNNKLLIIFIEETACHSYIQADNIRIASLDTLFTLFLSFRYISLPPLSSQSIVCLIESMTHVQKKIRTGKHLLYPAFALECEGHQPQFASLLKARKKRLAAMMRIKHGSKFRSTKKVSDINANITVKKSRLPLA